MTCRNATQAFSKGLKHSALDAFKESISLRMKFAGDFTKIKVRINNTIPKAANI